MTIFTLFILNQFRFQNSGVNKSKTVNNSRRPSNIRNDSSHLAASGREFHEYAGPVSPNPGPIFPMLDTTQPIDSSASIPIPIIINMPMIAIMKYKKKNASTVETMEGDMTCLFTRTGNTALGWRICLNSLRDTLARMTIRIHFSPPVVLPAHAPIIMTMVSNPQSMGVHSM